LPGNVVLLGVVPNALKEALLSVAAIAINPMSEGSGTNMKMLDYLAAGVPVVSTEVGARGLELDRGRHARIVPLERFPTAIRASLEESPDEADARAREGRRHVEEHFDWAVVARGLEVAVDRLSADEQRTVARA
jgi:glycosyltransferase involved in cell wall biosynthesis